MRELEQAIIERGTVLGKDLLKVDSFLNHAIDTALMEQIGKAFAAHFQNKGITKVVTVETGGIAPAYETARQLGVPMVFCKKTEPSTMQNPVWTEVFSYTKQKPYVICVEEGCFGETDRLLFIDDFLANGEAFKGVQRLAAACCAKLAGCGICIEKAAQKGHDIVVQSGADLCVLAAIDSMDENGIVFMQER